MCLLNPRMQKITSQGELLTEVKKLLDQSPKTMGKGWEYNFRLHPTRTAYDPNHDIIIANRKDPYAWLHELGHRRRFQKGKNLEMFLKKIATKPDSILKKMGRVVSPYARVLEEALAWKEAKNLAPSHMKPNILKEAKVPLLTYARGPLSTIPALAGAGLAAYFAARGLNE